MKYEYRVESLINFATEHQEGDLLKEAGLLGWELVSVVVKMVKGEYLTFYYFRRPKADKKAK